MKESKDDLNSIVQHNLPFNYYRKKGVSLPWSKKLYSEYEMQIDKEIKNLKNEVEIKKVKSREKYFRVLETPPHSESTSLHSKSIRSKFSTI